MKQLGMILFLLSTTLSFNALSSEDSLYDFLWLDPDKSVYVLQNKLYKKTNSFYLELDAGVAFGDEFLNTHNVNLKIGYYFSEEWGIEIFGSKYFNSFANNKGEVKRIANVSPFLRQPEQAIGATLLWTPFYGKINTFNKIFYFDWGFGLGAAMLDTTSNLKTAGSTTLKERFDDEDQISFVYKTDFKFHLNRHWHFTAELRGMLFSAPLVGGLGDGPGGVNTEGENKIFDYYDFMLGVGYKF